MIRFPFAVATPFRRFVRQEHGVATVDWVIISATATGAALIALEIGQGSVTGYTAGIRDEVQSPYFDTSWTSTLEIPPREYWEERDPIVPVADPQPQPDPDPVPDPQPEPEPPPPEPEPEPEPEPPPPEPEPEPEPEPPPDDGPQIVTGVILGCPSAAYISQPRTTTAAQLVDDGLVVNVTASGSTNVSTCSDLPGTGYFNANPTVTLDLSGFSDDFRRVEVRTSTSCRASILLRDAQGNWYAGRRNADNRLRIEDDFANLNGLVSIWVGMEQAGSCSNTEVSISARD